MDGAQVRVFEEVDQEGLGGFLERLDRLALPAQGVAVHGDEFEGGFAHLGGLLLVEGGTGRGGGDLRGGRMGA